MLNTPSVIAYLPHMLGNRLRALAACFVVSKALDRDFAVYWDVNQGFPLEFESVFEGKVNLLTPDTLLSLRGADSLGLYTQIFDWHGYQNELAHGRPYLSELRKIHGVRQVTDLTSAASETHILIYTNTFHPNFDMGLQLDAFRHFRFNHSLVSHALSVVKDLNLRGLPSVHARGTDFVPLPDNEDSRFEFYVNAISNRVAQDEAFYLSSEDRNLVFKLEQHFGARLVRRKNTLLPTITSSGNLSLDKASLCDAIVDLIILSCTNLVVYHEYSSFAQSALILRGVY